MTVEERLPYMIEWWQRSHNLMIEQKLSRDGMLNDDEKVSNRVEN